MDLWCSPPWPLEDPRFTWTEVDPAWGEVMWKTSLPPVALRGEEREWTETGGWVGLWGGGEFRRGEKWQMYL